MNFREGERDSWGHTKCFARIFFRIKTVWFRFVKCLKALSAVSGQLKQETHHPNINIKRLTLETTNYYEGIHRFTVQPKRHLGYPLSEGVCTLIWKIVKNT